MTSLDSNVTGTFQEYYKEQTVSLVDDGGL